MDGLVLGRAAPFMSPLWGGLELWLAGVTRNEDDNSGWDPVLGQKGIGSGGVMMRLKTHEAEAMVPFLQGLVEAKWEWMWDPVLYGVQSRGPQSLTNEECLSES